MLRLKRLVAILLSIVLVGIFILSAILMLLHYDSTIRKGLLREAQLSSKSIDIKNIKSLAGSKADLKKSTYKKLKHQLLELKISIPKCRFAYLLGQNANGNVFFYADNEPDNSVDYSPPGQIYQDTTTKLRNSFYDGYPFVEGPVKDEWGEWTSALVPIRDTDKGTVVAVFGVDIDAKDWNMTVYSRAAFPIGLMLIVLIGTLTMIYASMRSKKMPSHVMGRLLLPLFLVVFILVAGAGTLLVYIYNLKLNKRLHLINNTITDELLVDLDNQGHGLVETLVALSMTPSTQKTPFSTISRDKLKKQWEPLFKALRNRNIEIMAFYDRNFNCILRMQASTIQNNKVQRASFLKAEKTRSPVSGLEMLDGELSLRAIQPILKNGRIDGYIELGKDIDDILETRHNLSGCMLIVLADKTSLNQQQWELQMKESQRDPNWDLLPDNIVVYSSNNWLRNEIAPLNHVLSHEKPHCDDNLEFNGRIWRATVSFIYDSSGKEIAKIIALSDVTDSINEFHNIIILSGVLAGSLLTGLMAFIVVILRHTDIGIRAQQACLHDSRERLSATLHSIGEGVISVDQAGKIVEMNLQAEILTKWKAEQATGHDIDDVFKIIDPNNPENIISPVSLALQGQRSECFEPKFSLSSRTGNEYLITFSCNPVYDKQQKITGAVLVFHDMTAEHFKTRQIQESEKRFNIVASQTRVVIWETNTEGLYTYVSNSSEDVWGYRPRDIIGKMYFYDLHPAEGRQKFKQEAFQKLKDNKPFKDFLHKFQTIKGDIVWISTTCIPISDNAGITIGYHGTDVDVTENILKDEKLRESEENYQIVFENSQVGTFKTRVSDGKVLACNERCAAILGYDSVDDLLDNYSADKAYVDISARQELIDNLNEKGRFDNYELNFYKKDGNTIWIELSSRLYRGFIISVMSDITERVHMREYNKLYSSCMGILNSSKDLDAALNKVLTELVSVSGCDAAGIRLQDGEDFPYFCQTGFSEEFLWTENFLISQNPDGKIKRNRNGTAKLECFCGMVLSGRTIPDNPLFTNYGSVWTNDAREALKLPKSQDPRYNPRNVCVHRFYRSLALVPIKVKSEIIGLLQLNSKKTGLFSETAVQQLEKIAAHIGIAIHRQEEEHILRDALSQSQVATATKSQFMANMSHEMRTPLNGIIGVTELLNDSSLTEEQKQYISVINRSGAQILGIVDDILNAAKTTVGEVKIINEPIGIKTLVHNSLNQLMIRAEEKNIDFKVDIDQAIPDILLSDSSHISLILKHLADNAVKFTEKGEISVNCSILKQDDKYMHLKFVIKDSGIGIPPDRIKHIFEPFSQADNSDTRQYGGAGLGLTISRQMADIMGGKLEIKSTQGKGTTCTFSIPMLLPPPEDTP